MLHRFFKGVRILRSIGKLDELSKTEIAGIDGTLLTDIKTISTDKSLPAESRMSRYLSQIGNPYCFRCGKTPVKVRFSETGRTLDDAIIEHYIGLKL